MEIILEIPVEIGDTLYFIKESVIHKCTVKDIIIDFHVRYCNTENKDLGIKIVVDKDFRSDMGGNKFYPRELNEIIFKSKTDILKKLAEQL